MQTLPTRKMSWRAHDNAILYVAFVEHLRDICVISSSADSVKMWSAEGGHIGTFNQVSQQAVIQNQNQIIFISDAQIPEES